jgi:protein phosphatase
MLYVAARTTTGRVTGRATLASDLRDTGFIGPLEAGWDHIITRVLGMNETVRPSHCELDRRAGDLVVLCSDGICPMLDEERISAILDLDQPPDASCRALVDAAEQAGGYDNETVVIARI